MSEYVNAGIETKQELLKRLVDGEEFYTEKGVRVCCNWSFDNPFRLGGVGLDLGLSEVLYRDLTIKKEWYDCLPEKERLCWVGDSQWSIDAKEFSRWVVDFDLELESKFKDDKGLRWELAEPVKPEDLIQDA